MMDNFGGMGAGFGWVFMLLLLVGTAALVVLAVRLAIGGPDRRGYRPPEAQGGRARAILDERYARGEVTRDEFLERVRASRKLHGNWVSGPSDADAFASWLRRARTADRESLLVCREEGGAIAGVYNIGQIFYGPFRSAYLGYYGFAPFAGRGYMRENVAERFWREVRVDRIWEGTSEVQRSIIADQLGKRGVGPLIG